MPNWLWRITLWVRTRAASTALVAVMTANSRVVLGVHLVMEQSHSHSPVWLLLRENFPVNLTPWLISRGRNSKAWQSTEKSWNQIQKIFQKVTITITSSSSYLFICNCFTFIVKELLFSSKLTKLNIWNIKSGLIIRKTYKEIRNVTVDEFPWRLLYETIWKRKAFILHVWGAGCC